MTRVRDARAEASARIGHRLDVRVLEPSPPAGTLAPFFADDPLEGGEVLPVVRAGSRTWDDVCAESGDPELRPWCADRWLVPGDPPILPRRFVETSLALHRVAEHLLAAARYRATGKIGLRFTYRRDGSPGVGGVQNSRAAQVIRDQELMNALTSRCPVCVSRR